jgi:hypothetical protein
MLEAGLPSYTGSGNHRIQEGRSPRGGEVSVPKYVIEREIPAAGSLTAEGLREITQRSCCVLEELGPAIQWVESYVTDDKIYCVYIAPDTDLIREHARRTGFPANRVSEVRAVIGPKVSDRQGAGANEAEETGAD